MADNEIQPYTAEQEADAVKFMRLMSRLQAWLFKKTGGRFFTWFGRLRLPQLLQWLSRNLHPGCIPVA